MLDIINVHKSFNIGAPVQKDALTGLNLHLDKGDFVLAGIGKKSLLQGAEIAIAMNADKDYGMPVPVYQDKNVAMKVVRIIQSYTEIVNRVVWSKYDNGV